MYKGLKKFAPKKKDSSVNLVGLVDGSESLATDKTVASVADKNALVESSSSSSSSTAVSSSSSSSSSAVSRKRSSSSESTGNTLVITTSNAGDAVARKKSGSISLRKKNESNKLSSTTGQKKEIASVSTTSRTIPISLVDTLQILTPAVSGSSSSGRATIAKETCDIIRSSKSQTKKGNKAVSRETLVGVHEDVEASVEPAKKKRKSTATKITDKQLDGKQQAVAFPLTAFDRITCYLKRTELGVEGMKIHSLNGIPAIESIELADHPGADFTATASNTSAAAATTAAGRRRTRSSSSSSEADGDTKRPSSTNPATNSVVHGSTGAVGAAVYYPPLVPLGKSTTVVKTALQQNCSQLKRLQVGDLLLAVGNHDVRALLALSKKGGQDVFDKIQAALCYDKSKDRSSQLTEDGCKVSISNQVDPMTVCVVFARRK